MEPSSTKSILISVSQGYIAKQRRFFKALEDEQRELVKEMLRSDGSLANSLDGDKTALMFAVQIDAEETNVASHGIVVDLLDHGADIHARDNRNQTVLHFAVSHRPRDSVEIVRLLLKRGADWSAQDGDGLTAFHLATMARDTEMVRTLIDLHPAIISVPDDMGQTPLHSAVMRWHKFLIRMLLEHGADANIQDNDGNIPLHLAWRRKLDTRIGLLVDRESTMELLLSRTLNLSLANKEGSTPLHTAIYNNDADLVRMLLEHGVDTTRIDNNGDTPLHLAARWVRPRLFLTVDDDDYGAQSNFLIFHLLLERHDDVNVKNNAGETPLLTLLGNDDGTFQIEKKVKELLSKDADVNATMEDGTTPLHLACSCKRDPVTVQLLLAYQADVNACDNKGMTPLHLASCLSFVEPSYADTEDENVECTFLDSYQIALVLLDNEPNLDCQNEDGDSPLHLACLKSSLSLVLLLVDYGANTSLTNKVGNTAMHEVFKYVPVQETTARVTLLLNRGANCTVPNHSGDTCFALACATGQLDLIYSMIRFSPHHLRPQLVVVKRMDSTAAEWYNLTPRQRRKRKLESA